MLVATGLSGGIAAQLAVRRGARVVVAGRNQRVLDELVGRGADVAIRVDRPREELAEAIAAAGPYDLIADYLWGPARRGGIRRPDALGPGQRHRPRSRG